MYLMSRTAPNLGRAAPLGCAPGDCMFECTAYCMDSCNMYCISGCYHTCRGYCSAACRDLEYSA